MKVILSQDVDGLGGVGDVVEVADGYANNFLISRNMAVVATTGNLKHWEEKRGWILKREAATRAEAEQLAAQLEAAKVTIVAKAGEEGRLYGSVTVKDIATRISEDLKIEVDRKKILLPEPIKTAGEHRATIRLFKDVEATVVVDVTADREPGLEMPPVEEVEAAEETTAESTDEPAQPESASEEEASGGAGDQPEA